MNKYTAQVPISIGGKEYGLELDWRAVSRIYSEVSPTAFTNMFRHAPEDVARIIHAGLAKNHPEVTLDMILDAGMPFLPTFEVINKALAYFYFGADGPPEDSQPEPAADSKKN